MYIHTNIHMYVSTHIYAYICLPIYVFMNTNVFVLNTEKTKSKNYTLDGAKVLFH